MAHQMHAPSRLDAGDGVAPYPDSGRGWAVFAGVMFLTVSAANALYGISALANDDYFAADELLFGDLAAWGVMSLLFAFFQVCAGVMILRRQAFGAFVGILLASLHGLVALASIGAYPLWTTIVLVIDGLIIYGLSVHGGDWA
jgi:hypothetical protein